MQKITLGYKELCHQAEREISQLTIEEALAMSERSDVVIVDIRDIRELWREGKIPGSIHAPRGMLEFWIDPESPYHKEVFAEDKSFIFHCAGGLRSILATQVAQQMGMAPVYNMIGGFAAWQRHGAAIEKVEK